MSNTKETTNTPLLSIPLNEIVVSVSQDEYGVLVTLKAKSSGQVVSMRHPALLQAISALTRANELVLNGVIRTPAPAAPAAPAAPPPEESQEEDQPSR